MQDSPDNVLQPGWLDDIKWTDDGLVPAIAQDAGKGESSGHQQVLRDIRLDCDADVILLKVEQKGGIACHTGRRSCFYRTLKDGQWVSAEPVLKDPNAIYGSN